MSTKGKASIEQVANDLENGNIKEAKAGAKSMTTFRISMYLRQIKGWSFERATAGAKFLKGQLDWQTYCDTK
jgi:hypothetical protein